MKVSNFLQMPQFHEFKLLTQPDYFDREITSVNVIDSPDSDQFCKGGEFLLTNTFAMQDNRCCSNMNTGKLN